MHILHSRMHPGEVGSWNEEIQLEHTPTGRGEVPYCTGYTFTTYLNPIQIPTKSEQHTKEF